MPTSDFPTVPAVIDRMKAEINELIDAGTIPADVSSFSQLHDFIDANMLAEDLFPPFPEEMDDEDDYMDRVVVIFNPASFAVDDWLAAGRP